MLRNHFLKILAYTIVVSGIFCSCSDWKANSNVTASQELNTDSNFNALIEENKILEEKFELPPVDLKKIKELKEDGPYGFSEFYYYIYSNFETEVAYKDEGAPEEFDLYLCSFQNEIEYQTSIHLDNPRHFIESYTLPSVEMESLLKTLEIIYPDFKFDCQNNTQYCEYTSYETDEVKNVFFQTSGKSTKIGISYR